MVRESEVSQDFKILLLTMRRKIVTMGSRMYCPWPTDPRFYGSWISQIGVAKNISTIRIS